MPDDGDTTISNWIAGIRDGDSVAAEQLWDRYFASLVAVARQKMRGFDRVRDGEDVAASAMKSVMLRIRDDRAAPLEDRDGLWPLLVTIAARKAVDEKRRQSAKKRDGRHVSIDEVSSIVGKQPSPEFVATLTETLDNLVVTLGDEQLRTIALRKLEGYTHEEIAKELGCAPRTVIRKLNRVRQEWNHDIE